MMLETLWVVTHTSFSGQKTNCTKIYILLLRNLIIRGIWPSSIWKYTWTHWKGSLVVGIRNPLTLVQNWISEAVPFEKNDLLEGTVQRMGKSFLIWENFNESLAANISKGRKYWDGVQLRSKSKIAEQMFETLLHHNEGRDIAERPASHSKVKYEKINRFQNKEMKNLPAFSETPFWTWTAVVYKSISCGCNSTYFSKTVTSLTRRIEGHRKKASLLVQFLPECGTEVGRPELESETVKQTGITKTLYAWSIAKRRAEPQKHSREMSLNL